MDGNVAADQGLKNCQALIGASSIDYCIPVYVGARGPLVPGLSEKELWPGHGQDGIGNFTFTERFKV